jgi:hypothetical protein
MGEGKGLKPVKKVSRIIRLNGPMELAQEITIPRFSEITNFERDKQNGEILVLSMQHFE